MTKTELEQKLQNREDTVQKLWDGIFLCGYAAASARIRRNENWHIICAIAMPHKKGERDCEIVIAKSKRRVQPYVAWHCFDGDSYAWGYYCNTEEEAKECAKVKIRRELGIGEEC